MKKLFFLIIVSFSIIGFSQTDNLNLMPWPNEITEGSKQFVIEPNFVISLNNQPTKRVEIATTNFLRRLSNKTGVFIKEGFAFESDELDNISLSITFERVGRLELNEDETYTLKVSKNKISINATTDIGVVYALETLFQLVTNNENYYFFPEVSINDDPRFAWRGLMMDVSRHFMPVDVIKRNLDAMTFVKMNVFHWHLADDQGFRIESKTHPKLHELGSDGLYYTQEQIRDVVQYASDRGIRVVPEVDVPGHATAILTAYPEISSKDMIYSIERNSGIFDPTLDPTNEETYKILGDLFGEMAELFPDKYVHIGGDENEGKHWDENEEIQLFMKENDLKNNHELQTYFNIRLEKILLSYDKSLMGWEEIMTSQMPKTALIHSWKGVNEGLTPGQSLVDAAQKGYKVILSNGYYIDLMQPAKDHYSVDPMPEGNNLSLLEESRILGGEATMWSELVTPLTIDSRIWPRTAAIAERLWSPKGVKDEDEMYIRLEVINNTLEQIGLTHIKNKAGILRNISNYQSIGALDKLSRISEPFKIYSRNKGGTEYKTYSPFTLFADACTADATDAYRFNSLTEKFVSTADLDAKKEIIEFLKSWGQIDSELSLLSQNAPLVLPILPYAHRVSEIADLLLNGIEKNKLFKKDFDKIQKLLSTKEDPSLNLDVELAVTNSLKELAKFLAKD